MTYEQQIDMSGTSAQPFEHLIELNHMDGISVQARYPKTPIPKKIVNKDGKTSILIKSPDTSYIFKDFIADKMFSQERIYTNYYNVVDSLSVFKWEILPDTLTILSFKCQKAITTFRGRKFETYFANDIPVADGPAKYSGLPGLILKVKILDKGPIYEINASRIKFSAEHKIINPYSGKKVSTFADFKRMALNKYEEMNSFNFDSSGGKVYNSGVEILENAATKHR